MSDIFKLSTDQTILGLDGNVVPNGQVHFYDKNTGRYAPIYGDPDLAVSLRQPIQADSSGVLPFIYLDDAVAYRAVITDRQNDRIREIDDVRREREGVKVLGGIDALKRFCGNDPFVLVATEGGCPVFYKRLTGCDLPAEHLPDVVRAECGCDCSVAWQLCGGESPAFDLCAMETAELNCDFHVLVQECPSEVDPDRPANSDGATRACDCAGDPAAGDAAAAAAPAVKKASIGALLSAAAQCLPKTCIPHDAPELAIVNGGLVQGDRVPGPLKWTTLGARWAGCILVVAGTDADKDYRHVQLDKLTDLGPPPTKVAAPEILLTNPGPCIRRYEIRALNRLNRAREHNPANWNKGEFHDPPVVDANFQTRLGIKGDPVVDPLLNSVFAPADYLNSLEWLTRLSIADSTMGSFNSGHGGPGANWDIRFSANGYTENDLIVDLAPGASVTCTLKYHIYWDMEASEEDLKSPERIHFGTRIIARQVR
jgi:hypothetical protein